MALSSPLPAGELPAGRFGSVPVWRLAAHLLQLIGRYVRQDPLLGSLLLAVMLGASSATGWLAVRSTVMFGQVIDSLVSRDAPASHAALIAAFFIFLGFVAANLISLGAVYLFRIRWREAITRRLLAGWMAGNRYYRLTREGRADNPEQRIQEDLFLIADGVTQLLPDVVRSLVLLVLSTRLLWKYSFPVTWDLAGIHVEVPGIHLMVTLTLGVLWTIASHFAGRAITRIEVQRQRREADFRMHIGHVREYGEAIAFERGGSLEHAHALGLFALIRSNWMIFTVVQLRLFTFNLFASAFARFVPVLTSMPLILAGKMTVGQLTVVSTAFAQVLDGMIIFARSYAAIAQLLASVARVRLFEEELERPVSSGIAVNCASRGAIDVQNLVITLPQGQPLLGIDALHILPGERVLLRGRSGTGKSTFLRVLARLWPYGSGRVELPEGDGVMFLPQRSYVRSGSFASLLSYPSAPLPEEYGRYAEVLRRLSLDSYVARLDEQAEWRTVLSPGEQQRVAAARALLRRPSLLFLDEATSALDTELEASLYEALLAELPQATIVSVAHRPAVARFHQRAIHFVDGRALPAAL